MAYLNESHIEEADIRLFEQLGYTHLSGGDKQLLGRKNLREVVLRDRLRAALRRLNPALPGSCLTEAITELTRSRANLEPVAANEQLYQLLRQGVPVTYAQPDGEEAQGYVRLLDFEQPAANDLVVVSQLSIEYLHLAGKTRRPDLLLYVNGLPLVMIELKNATQKVKQGYDKNLLDYRRDIPQLFWYNLFVCISNGIQTRLGAFSAEWGHFFTWAKQADPAVQPDQLGLDELERQSEQSDRKLTLEVFGESLCRPAPLLDYLENFVLYHKHKVKIIAKNHQFLGVNNALASLQDREGKKGKLGVFWHTQGSGKSYSMIFFARKVRHKVPGNWSFLIITDRSDLDGQIYRNFLETGTVVETKGTPSQRQHYYRPRNREQLREYLQSNRSYLFTLIHKFGIAKGKSYPLLTERDDWVVMVDEAHRTQYKGFAENMRIALPNAQFIAFTGTPLLRSELTKDWFGPYVSEYNFAQSIEDGATVPLFYKKSVPRVEQVNENLVGDAAAILEDENLTEEQQRKLDREYSTLLQVVRREDRLQEIARHIVRHYPYRLDVEDEAGNRKPMKAMVVSIDKFTAVRMYELVQAAQKAEVKELRRKIRHTRDPEEKARYQRAIDFIDETRMAVVISQEGTDADERAKFEAQGLNIAPHRRLMEHPDEDGRNIEDYFKDPNSTYRIVFVTAMWLTGFDAPAVSTLYLDKPLQNHNLMQAIARANRVFEGKKNGLVVDYFGVFRNLKKALASYAEGSKGQGGETEEFPVKEFAELLLLLEEAVAEATQFCQELGADMEVILGKRETVFQEIAQFADYAELILAKDEYRKQLGLYVNTINSLYDSAKPEVYDYPDLRQARDAFEYLRKVVERQVDQDAAVARARQRVDELLDSSVLGMGDLEGAVEHPKAPFLIEEAQQIDLSKLNFEQLRAEFPQQAHPRIQFADLRQLMEIKLRQMLAQNQTRVDFLTRFEDLIEQYNSESLSLEEAYEELVRQAQALSEEQQRAARNGMTEAEQELFDLLKKDKLTREEERQVKLAAHDLLAILEDQRVMVQAWYKDPATQARVRQTIQTVLHQQLPPSYDRHIFSEKTETIYRHFYHLGESGRGYVA